MCLRRNRPLLSIVLFFLFIVVVVQSFVVTTTTTTTAVVVVHRQQASPLAYRNDDSTTTVIDVDDCSSSTASSSVTAAAATHNNKNKNNNNNNSPLQTAMLESYFTETESLQVLSALDRATTTTTTSGRRQTAAAAVADTGALLTLLVGMEMGVHALQAAAFHWNNCNHHNNDDNDYYYYAEQSPHVADICADADRLAELEQLARRQQQQQQQSQQQQATNDDNHNNLRKLMLSETRDWRALAIRAAACLHTLRTTPTLTTAREALRVYAPLASRLGFHRLKNELETVAFHLLYPRQYARVTAAATRSHMTTLLEQIEENVQTLLEQDDEFMASTRDFSVTARVKEPYSMWRKMLMRGYKDVAEVPDALALRIVVHAVRGDGDSAETARMRDQNLCYYAQEICARHYSPALEPRFKDYIQSPKDNGYQSLHYTAGDGDSSWTCEIQIRSGEMHQVAEFGLASHWDYKHSQGDGGRQLDNSSAAYLSHLRQWEGTAAFNASTKASSESIARNDVWQSRRRIERIHERAAKLEPYLQALTEAQSELNEIFCFMDGRVVALPSGACALDALRHSSSTSTTTAAAQELVVVNGVHTPLTKMLNNGDVLAVSA